MRSGVLPPLFSAPFYGSQWGPRRRALAILAPVLLLLAACSIRQTPAPVGTAALRPGQPRRLSDRPALSPPAWSPQGDRIAYATTDGIWVQPLAGRERRLAPSGVVTDLAWSPAGQLLAYIDRGEVWVLRVDGSRRRRIRLPPSRDGMPWFATHLAWGRTGDRFAVAARAAGARPGAPPRAGVWLLGADGGFRRLVYERTGVEVAGVQWFPDDLFLFIVVGGREGQPPTLWRWRIAYPDRRPLLRVVPDAWFHRLSPDGRRVAFVAPEAVRPSAPDGARVPTPSQRQHVWVTNADGGARRRLTEQPARVTGLDWSPASEKVAFATVLGDAHGEIWIADVVGPGRLRAARFTAEFPDPALPLQVRWAPDGRHLAYGTNSGSYTGLVWVVPLERR